MSTSFFNCKDINECETGDHQCDSHGTCQNLDGSYRCDCQTGFTHGQQDTFTPYKCQDIDECEDNPCGLGSSCVNTVGSFICEVTCPVGYRKDDNQVGVTSCVNINECENSSVCPADQNQICVDTEGSFYCACQLGYHKFEPVDIFATDSESTENEENSRSDSSDLDTNKFECLDDDECYLGTHNCVENSQCVNLPGTFTCECKVGYQPDPNSLDLSCIDIDECATESHDCSRNLETYMRCINTIGSFTCEGCPSGYQMRVETETCHDIDECQNDNGGCQQICTNIKFDEISGGRVCSCQEGFSLNEDAKTCSVSQVSQCLTGQHDCSGPGATCVDKSEGFECRCSLNGYRLDNHTCVDVNECLEDLNSCLEDQICENTEGSFICHNKKEQKSACPTNNRCDHQCNVDPQNSDNYVCSCWEGYTLSCDLSTCLPVEGYDQFTIDPFLSDSCPPNFAKFGGKYDLSAQANCFYVSDFKLDRISATKYCQTLHPNSNLAMIHNQEQNFYLSQWMGVDKVYWIDAIKSQDQTHFIWESSGERINFMHWAANEPSSKSENHQENCVVSNWGFSGDWNDLSCDYGEFYFACSI